MSVCDINFLELIKSSIIIYVPLCRRHCVTRNMVMKNVNCEEANIDAVVDRLKCVEESIDTFLEKHSVQIDSVSNNNEKIISNSNIDNRRIDAIINRLKTIQQYQSEAKTESNKKKVELNRGAISEKTTYIAVTRVNGNASWRDTVVQNQVTSTSADQGD